MSKFICEKCQSSSTCQLYQVSQRYSLSPIKSCYQFKKKKPTNADRIRSMTDEEIAKVFTDDLCELLCNSPCTCDGQCESQMLTWLKQEATE